MTRFLLAFLIVPVALTLGCSTTRSKEAADREVYGLVDEKRALVVGTPEEFDIAPPEAWDPLANTATVESNIEALAEAQVDETGANVLTLEQALLIAVNQSRTYQNEKERLFLEGLSLTLDRHRYTPIFGGGASVGIERDTVEGTRPSDFTSALSSARTVVTELENLTGTPADLLQQFADVVEQAGATQGLTDPVTVVEETEEVSGGADLAVDLLLRGGGALALGITTNALRFLTGDTFETASTLISGSFTQPLLAGAGRDVGMERLTQAERSFLYGLRRYTFFRMTFAVQVCSAYYEVLQQRDAAVNNYRRFRSFQQNTERERAFAEVGRSTIAQVGRQEQGLLTSEDDWVNSVRQYRESLDAFKILLGLSTDARIVLDDKELVALREQGLNHPSVNAEDAVKVAVVSRLDLHTAEDQMADAERRVKVAASALKPGLDLIVAADVRSQGDDAFEDIDINRTRWNAGVDLDLPLNKKAERNNYRAALIDEERAKREYSLAEDTIKLELREGWRNLDQARRNYETALKSVELNQRRVDEQSLLADLGRGSVLDQVDAQNNLTESENNLTAALVRHNVARLALWRDMGILYIKPDGQWEEIRDDFTYPAVEEAADVKAES